MIECSFFFIYLKLYQIVFCRFLHKYSYCVLAHGLFYDSAVITCRSVHLVFFFFNLHLTNHIVYIGPMKISSVYSFLMDS